MAHGPLEAEISALLWETLEEGVSKVANAKRCGQLVHM
jgi:hypothetical protein